MSGNSRERAAADREIDPVAREIDELVGGTDIDANLWIATNQVREERCEEASYECDRGGDPNPARGPTCDGGLLERVGGAHGLACGLEELLAIFGQRECVRRAMEELHAGRPLEARDGLRHARCRHAEAAAGLGEGPGVDSGDGAARGRGGGGGPRGAGPD